MTRTGLSSCLAMMLGAVLSASGGRVVPTPSTLERFEAVQPHMGTLARITVFTADAADARAAFTAGFDRIRALNATLSDYLPDSEINRITRTAVGVPVPVSADLFTVLRAAQDLSVATDGAFDITQGPVTRLWRDARKTRLAPDAAALSDAARRTGYRKLHLDDVTRSVAVAQPEMALDVGAIGKGHAASEALAAISQLGVRSALVAISGDLAFSGAPPGQRGWRIRIHDGDLPDPRVPAVLHLTHAAVSTSGNSEQYLDVDGRRYSHVIDPATGLGLVDDITVTVVAPHGLEADGLDTALGVLGVERALALVESRRDAAALIVHRTRDGVRVVPSSRFIELARRQLAAQ